ncbi:hypothetical protein [uncultured Flavobacterium sp.]|uniref:hypothetical protein n=1 Tax=uncultured Flavobacterium sp. TaxID=165435 RepID=UPI0025DF17C9|nr:hypothetical protein [uncultured Flavobacterium sp.]
MSILDNDSEEDALATTGGEATHNTLKQEEVTVEQSEILELLNDDYYIADTEDVYMRINRANIDFTQTDPILKILPVAFDPKGNDGLSVDRSKFAEPKDTQNRGRFPERNGVLSWNVGAIRKVPFSCEVVYDPVTTEEEVNLAHSLVKGVPPRKPNGLEFRINLRQICSWKIECPNEQDFAKNN